MGNYIIPEMEGKKVKEIILRFKTPKGEKAYWLVEEEGKKQSYMDRKIGRAVAKDTVLSKHPLIVKIKVKVKRLAKKVCLDDKVVEGLAKHGAKKDVDYEMEVRR